MAGSMRLARPREVTNPCARGVCRAAIDVAGSALGCGEAQGMNRGCQAAGEVEVEVRMETGVWLLKLENVAGMQPDSIGKGPLEIRAHWKGQLHDPSSPSSNWLLPESIRHGLTRLGLGLNSEREPPREPQADPRMDPLCVASTVHNPHRDITALADFTRSRPSTPVAHPRNPSR